MRGQTEKINDDSYIPYYRPSDAADKHLEVNSFQTEAASATLDLAKKSNGAREKPRKVKIKILFKSNLESVTRTLGLG